ncbi:Glycopeptide antibiotics resistance protein OS=Ureibacillus acetophenoni OX=614649 GN=SAMN05877842_11937 PE=4 SV=1 [Ureibacillus acetophenoni]
MKLNKNNIISLIAAQIVFILSLPIWIELTKYLHPIVIGVVWFLITFIFLFSFSWIKREEIQIWRGILHAITAIYTLGLLILLFFRPSGASFGAMNLIPFQTISYYLSGDTNLLIAFYNLSANIGLFIPFGVYYRYVNKTPSMKKLIFISVVSICLIELLQFWTKRGSLDIDDLILNVFGVMIGYLIFPFFKKVFVVVGRGDR